MRELRPSDALDHSKQLHTTNLQELRLWYEMGRLQRRRRQRLFQHDIPRLRRYDCGRGVLELRGCLDRTEKWRFVSTVGPMVGVHRLCGHIGIDICSYHICIVVGNISENCCSQ